MNSIILFILGIGGFIPSIAMIIVGFEDLINHELFGGLLALSYGISILIMSFVMVLSGL